jgi:hypothetical protein
VHQRSATPAVFLGGFLLEKKSPDMPFRHVSPQRKLGVRIAPGAPMFPRSRNQGQ